MLLVSLSDWYSMSWPSTFRLAMVKMLLSVIFCAMESALPTTLDSVCWTSLAAGISFHVVRNTRLSSWPSSVNRMCAGMRQAK